MPPSAAAAPPGWPQGLPYLSAPIYSPHLNAAEIKALRPGRPSLSLSSSSSSSSSSKRLAKIQRIHEPPDHPALGQHGLFAAQHLAPGSVIVDYLGFVHSSRDDADPRSDYDLSLDRDLGIGVDAARMGNEARFINDYRGVRRGGGGGGGSGSGPNAEFVERLVNGERRMSVRVLPVRKSGEGRKGIGKGEEILVNYGKGFWQHRRAAEQ